MRHLLIFFAFCCLLLAGVSCKSTQEPPGFSNTSSKMEKSDSTSTKETIRIIQLPGSVVHQAINYDSLRSLYTAGQINRYYTVTDKEGLTELQTKVDLLTGRLQQECRTNDSVITAKDTYIYRLEKQAEAWQEIMQPAPVVENKSWLDKKLDSLDVLLNWLGVGFLVVLAVKLFGVKLRSPLAPR